MNYKTALFKRNTELFLMSPFVLLGKLLGRLFTLNTQHNIFLFYPSADIGGSIKVNAEIAECIKDASPLIIFSKKPKNNEFRKMFDIPGVRVLDLHKYIDNKLYHFVNFFFRGVIASWVNKCESPVIFGGESLFFYKIVPHVKKETKVVELCHLNTWFNFSQAFVEYLDMRIFSTPQVKRDVEAQYKINGVPEVYYERLHFIDNAIDVQPPKQINNDLLQILFVGRGAPQKRVYLIAAAAKRIKEEGQSVHFTFVGDVEDIIPEDVKPYVTIHGNIRDKSRLEQIYDESDVLLLTSSNEGLPIVVMEMMARGKAIVSTAVGGIPDYIDHSKGGFLIYDKDEDDIVSKVVEYLVRLNSERELLHSMGDVNYQFAKRSFSYEVFCKYYRDILLQTDNN